MKRSEIGVRGKLRNGKVLGTQNVLGTPRKPFSHLLNEMSFVMKILLYKHDWDDEKRIYKLIIFVFGWITIAYVPLQDQNLVVRLKTSKS
jgi:hypothetical protein